MVFKNDLDVACFTTDSKGPEKRKALRSWLHGLEADGKDLATIDFACHTITPKTDKDTNGLKPTTLNGLKPTT